MSTARHHCHKYHCIIISIDHNCHDLKSQCSSNQFFIILKMSLTLDDLSFYVDTKERERALHEATLSPMKGRRHVFHAIHCLYWNLYVYD
jgi:hypothetical protein